MIIDHGEYMIELINDENLRTPGAILVGTNEEQLRELKGLVHAAGMETLALVTQMMEHPNPATYIGSGKVAELRELCINMGADFVIVEESLSPTQLKNLQHEVEAEVIDRTSLILKIFSDRAKTREARLQVESANLQYILPRLVGMRTSLGRQGGASGSLSNKGSGEKQLELDRRHIEKRISILRRELEAIEHDREIQRSKRMKSELPLVSLVGYTNAGKSTLMNTMLARYSNTDGENLENKSVEAKDMLFATLDTTIRRMSFEDKKDFLLSDTVGFIDNLPTGLVKAFRSTLEEAKYADLLLEVVDVSDEHCLEQMDVTTRTIQEIGADNVPCIYVMNKADRIMPESDLPKIVGDRIYMSAKTGTGLVNLVEMVKTMVYGAGCHVKLKFGYEAGGDLERFSQCAANVVRDYREDGVYVEADCSKIVAGRYAKYEIEKM